MKRSWLISAAIVVVVGGLLALGYTTREKNGSVNITAVGSTALQPLVEAAGEDYAAKNMGVFDRKGSLEDGKDADIMMFDKDLKLTYVMQMGNEVTNEL